MGGACSMYANNKNAAGVWWGGLEDRHLGRPRRRWDYNIKMYLK